MPFSSVPDSTAAAKPAGHARATQAEGPRTGEAVLESAARSLSRYGYGNLVLEGVAREFLAGGETAILAAGGGPDGVAVLRLRPGALDGWRSSATWRSSTSFPGGADAGSGERS